MAGSDNSSAASIAAAKDAAEQVAVDYRPLPVVTHAPTAVRPDAPLARTNTPSNVGIDALVGDAPATEAAFARAAHTASLTTWIQRVAGVPMEPRAALGEYDPATGQIVLDPLPLVIA